MSDMIERDSYGVADDENASQALLAYKSQMIKFFVLTGILIFFFAVIALFSALAVKSWRSGLKACVQTLLLESGYQDAVVGESVDLQNPFTESAAAFELSGCSYDKAVIIRVTTAFGPAPALFLYADTAKAAEFVCFAGLGGRVEKTLTDSSRNSLVKYWAARIPYVLAGTGDKADE